LIHQIVDIISCETVIAIAWARHVTLPLRVCGTTVNHHRSMCHIIHGFPSFQLYAHLMEKSPRISISTKE
jgi:hypothetical protein